MFRCLNPQAKLRGFFCFQEAAFQEWGGVPEEMIWAPQSSFSW